MEKSPINVNCNGNGNEECDGNIKVVLKVRPLLQKEVEDRLQRHWTLDPRERRIRCTSSDVPHYTFDDLFDESSDTRQLYDRFARPIVEAALDGINGTIFAYGQTASGKTYVIMGNKISPGIVPLAVHNIFDSIKTKNDRDFLIRVSFIEIYNEKIRDLLDSNNMDVKIREDYNGSISMTCKEQVTASPEELLDIMYQGNLVRSVGETVSNEKSSRSHSIFQIIIESRKHAEFGAESDDIVNVSQLNLVDLAGSERAWQAGNTKSFREGCHINKSLVTLSLVIRQLSTAGENTGFINYRDSKLTRILQSSLGGNAKTGIICTVTPTSFEETHSTLKFAMCAKTVQNKPRVNRVVSDATQLKILSKDLEMLKKELESKKNVEEDNLKLQLKISKLIVSAQILMGISEREVVKRNPHNRRQTWWGQHLKTINEDDPQLLDKNGSMSTFKRDVFRLSNLSDRNVNGFRDSIASNITDLAFEQTKRRFSDDVILLDTSDDEYNGNGSAGLCSPNHRCFDIRNTPPCVLRDRAKAAQKELKELEEMTSLEKQLGSGVNEYIIEAKNLKLRLQETIGESETYKNDILQLNSQIETLKKENIEYANIKLQLNKQLNDLKCENEGLSYQLETSKKSHKEREKEPLMSLEDARKSNTIQTTIPDRNSMIPIIQPESRKKCDNDDFSFKQKIEELEYKLNISNDKLEELSKEKNNLLLKIDDLKTDIDTKNSIILQYEQQINSCEISVMDFLKNKTLPKPNIVSKHFTEIQSLMLEYLNVNETLDENMQMCNSLKEKIVNLENTHNEIVSKVEYISKKISDLCPILNINCTSLQIDYTNIDVSLINFLNNMIDIVDKLNETLQNMYKDEYISSAHKSTEKFVSVFKEASFLKEDDSTNNQSDLMQSDLSRQSIGQSFKVINEKNDLVESVKYLEEIVDCFKHKLTIMLSDTKCDLSFVNPSNKTCMPIFDALCLKFENVENLYDSFVDATDNRLVTMESENVKLIDENQSLKLEIQNGLRNIRKLLFEAESLHKKILSQRNVQHVANAEFSLMASHVNAMDHYHTCLHATCDSTFSYIKKQLIQLQTCLQNSSVTNDVTDLMDISFDDCLSGSETMLKSQILDDGNQANCICSNEQIISEFKAKIETAYSSVDSKDRENKTLTEKILELESKITENKSHNDEIQKLIKRIDELENENIQLSDELMEYLQESDINKRKDRKNVSINTSVLLEKNNISCSTVLDDQLKMLTDENVKIKLELQSITSRYDILSKSESNLQEINVESHDKINQLNNNIVALRLELNELKQLTDSKQKTINDLEEKIKISCNKISLKNVDISTLEQESQYSQRIIASLKDDMAELKIKLDETLQNVEHEKTQNNLYISELLNNKLTLENITAEISNKNAAIDKLIAENSKLNEHLQSRLCDDNQLREEICMLQNLISSHKSIMNEKDEKIESLQHKLFSNIALISKLESDIQLFSHCKDMATELAEKLKITEQDKSVKNEEIEILQVKIESLESENMNQTHLIDDFRKSISNLRDTIKSHESQSDVKDVKIKQMEGHLNSIKSEYQQKIEFEFQEKVNLQNQIKSLQIDIQTYLEKIEECNLQISKYESDIQKSKYLLIVREKELGDLKQYNDKMTAELLNTKQNALVINEKVDKLQFDCHLYINQIKCKSAEESKLNEKLEAITTQNCLLENKMKNYEIENNRLNSTISELENRYKFELENKIDAGNLKCNVDKLNGELFNLKNEVDLKNGVISNLHAEVKSLTLQLKEYVSTESDLKKHLAEIQNEKSEIEKKLLEAESKANDKKSGVDTEFMEYFVDKLTYQMEQEKCKQLQEANNDLRNKNNNMIAEIRRMRHSLQNNTLSNLMPNDNNKLINEQKELIDKLKMQLNDRDSCIEKLNAMKNDEFNVLSQKIEKIENQSSDLHKENSSLKIRLANCELELNESKENSQIQERKKRRQSLYDMNCGCNSPMNNRNENENNASDNKQTELEKEISVLRKTVIELKSNNQELQIELFNTQSNIRNGNSYACTNCGSVERIIKEFEKLKARNKELELKLSSNTATNQDYSGSGIVMGQKLCEYMADNQRLKDVNSKLKELCRIRDRKIKELENAKPK